MNFEVLLPNQKKVCQTILNNYKNQNIIIRGNSGVGKTYVFEQLINEFKENNNIVLYLSSETLLSKREYYPLINCIKNHKQYFSFKDLLEESSKDIPLVGNISNYFLSSVIEYRNDYINNYELNILNSIEKEIFDRLYHLSRQGNVILLCDNIQFWDDQSLNFLYLLFNNEYMYYKLTRNIRFIINYTLVTNISKFSYIDKLLESFSFCNVFFEKLNFYDFVESMKILGLKKNLTKSQLKLLYELTDNHIEVIIQVIQEIENNELNFEENFENNNALLRDILHKRLLKLDLSGKQIKEILQYASIIGMTFDSYEIKNIFENLDDYEFSNLLNKAKEISLIYQNDKFTWTFIHEIVRHIFKNEVGISLKNYYFRLSQCLKEIKPYDFFRRGIYLMKCNETEEASKVFALYITQKVKNNIPFSKQKENELLMYINYESDFIRQITDAYNFYHQKKYEKAYNIAFAIPDIFDVALLAEKYILISCCLTKKLDTDSKVDACEKLESFASLDVLNYETAIYEELLNRLIITYAHSGNLKLARRYEDKLVKSLIKRIKYDSQATYQLYKMYRKSNAIYDCDIASLKINQSVRYFSSSNRAIGIKDYYISLINNSAVLLDCGEFIKSYACSSKALKLEKDYPNIDYPRPHILRSNFFIAGVLCRKIKIIDAINFYKETIKNSPIIPERIFLATNLSSLLAINNELEEAYTLLSNECKLQNVDDDIEGLYDLSANSNLIVFKYLLALEENEILISKLNEMNKRLKFILDYKYYEKRNEIISEFIQNNFICSSKEWLNSILNLCPSYIDNSWNYFGLGYVFVSLNNWE